MGPMRAGAGPGEVRAGTRRTVYRLLLHAVLPLAHRREPRLARLEQGRGVGAARGGRRRAPHQQRRQLPLAECAGRALQAEGSSAKTVAEAKSDPLVAAAIQKGIDKANLKAASKAQKVQKLVLLDGDLSVPGGELTGTQKLKRNVVNEKYAKQIESMYAGTA